LAGQTSNEAQLKYLMNNAIASKEQLNLAIGVTLTPPQVAALTHDIVWLEEHEVNGEKVLVPVLYLAQANNRLGPTGALIAGNDVTLTAGQELDNVGTLRATNNLSATAGTNLINTGLIEAGNRLDLLAGNDLINKAGGILYGRDVTLAATRGDVINERTVSRAGGLMGYEVFADSAARVESANDLTIKAGRDVQSIGSTLQAGRDLSLIGGRDVNIGVVQTERTRLFSTNSTQSSITQLGSSVSVGRDLMALSGRDINVVASDIDAKRDIAMAATENMTISSAADETHSLSRSKKLTVQTDHVKQVSADLNAGGSIALNAGQDLAVISSRITSGENANLSAGENLSLLAAQDSDYYLYDKKKKGSFGSKKTKRDEVTDIRNVGSEITSGGDLTLESGGDQLYQVAKLTSGNDLTLESGGGITFEGVKDLHQESHTKSSSSLAWTSMKGKGNTDETLRQTEMVAKGEIAIRAVEGLKIDIKQVDQQTVSQTIDAMVQADPQLAWLKEAEKRGDVDWRRVEEIHQGFKYSHSGLGAAAQLVLAIALALVTGGAGAGLVGAASGSFAAAFADAVLLSVANTAANGLISNKGDLAATLKETVSASSLKGYMVSGLTGGIGNSLGYNPLELGFDLNSAGDVFVKVVADTTVQTAFNGGSLSENFVGSLLGAAINIGGAVAANQIGNTQLTDGSPAKVAAHALLGGLKSMAMGGDFKTGALAGGANEMMVQYLADLVLPENYDPNGSGSQQGQANLLAMSQLMGVLAAVVTGGDPNIAANIAATATQYNYLGHSDLERAAKELLNCDNNSKCLTDAHARYYQLSRDQEANALVSCSQNPSNCAQISSIVARAQEDTAQFRAMADDASPETREVLNHLIAENDGFQNLLAGITAGHSVEAIAEAMTQVYGVSPKTAAEIAIGARTAISLYAAVAGKGRGIKVAENDGKNYLPPQEVGSPYFIRIDPITGQGPMAIDSSIFTSGSQTLGGGVRNSRQFWNAWKNSYGDTLSQENISRIEAKQSPIIDKHWVEKFPEHKDYLGETIVHHHLDYGKNAIPLPSSVHAKQPGWGIWHQEHSGQ
ncbi:DUF637 domain-containing protein, partial [Pseudomonas cichorii]|nr:DUF637 domain-containing protein [Pseudomonas cichorii]